MVPLQPPSAAGDFGPEPAGCFVIAKAALFFFVSIPEFQKRSNQIIIFLGSLLFPSWRNHAPVITFLVKKALWLSQKNKVARRATKNVLIL
jgi:hypothetical protein